MTTDKKHSISERLKALRDQVAGAIAAAEDEETSVADAALPEEPAAPSPEPEGRESAAYRRMSEDELASALRMFTWEPHEEAAEEQDHEPAEISEPEDVAAQLPETEEEELEKILLEYADKPEKDSPAGVETHEDDEPETDFFREAEEAAVPEAYIGQGSLETEETTPSEDETLSPEPYREAYMNEPIEDTAALTGIADLLARLRTEAEEKVSAEVTPEQRELMADFLTDVPETDEQEPDPEDVAKLWEPRKGRSREEKAEIGPVDPALDPDREETHVFTDEDLKNLPREEEGSGETGEEAQQLASDEEDEDYYDEEEGYTPRDFRLIRRRRYYRSGIVGGIMYFLFVVCVSVALAAFAWMAADDVLSLNKEYIEAEVYVGEDMDVDQIATELQTKGLVRYRRLFALFGKFFHADEKIEPGTYTLSTKLDYRALIQNMHHYTGWTGEARATVKVTIPEGKTVMETFQILAEHGVCPYETLMECAATEVFDYSFLRDIPEGDASRLEGYLFPDTYEFYADSSPKAAICRFLDNFGERIPERVEEQAAALGYSLQEIVIVASLIEKEAGNDTERATIASVIYNRLQSTSYPYLQIDATIQYAMGEHKESLTLADLEVDSPYNTYKYTGLPPGPIANPGLASIRAALNPESTGYYFYALHKNGNHKFFSSYNEFQRFINSSDYGG